MADEPSGFQAHAKGPMDLVGANALLGRRHKRHRLYPKVHRNVARLEHGSDLHGKGLAALVALVGADPGALALHLGNALDAAAMRTDGAVRPNAGFHPLVGGGFVVEWLGA